MGTSTWLVRQMCERGQLDYYKTTRKDYRINPQSIGWFYLSLADATQMHPFTIQLLLDGDARAERLSKSIGTTFPCSRIVESSNIYDTLFKIGRTPPDFLIADFSHVAERNFALINCILDSPEYDNMIIILLSCDEEDNPNLQRRGLSKRVFFLNANDSTTTIFRIISSYAKGLLTPKHSPPTHKG